MPNKIDESSKPRRSERLRGWWFKGVDAGPPPQREELSSAVRTHLDGMAGHALRIESAAVTDGARIRQEALTAAGTIVGHVEHLESQLALLENQYGRVIDTLRTELADLRTKLAQEAEAAEAAATESQPMLSAVPEPPALPANGHSGAHALPVA
jgi:hypothetical protein